MGYTYDYSYSTSVGDTELLGVLAGLGIAVWIVCVLASVLMIISLWKIFKKAGKNGWEAIIPIYNIVVLLEITKIPVWQIVFYMIPFANIYIMFKQYIELAKKFGKSTGFGVLTAFFPMICLPILAFGNAKYNGMNDVSNENDASILDVNEAGVPNNSEAKDFTYGYEKEETVVIPEINLNEGIVKTDSDKSTENNEEETNTNSDFSDDTKSE